MRVTNQMLTRNVLMNLQRNLKRMQGYQDQLSSGRSISRPSDNPLSTSRIMGLKTNLKTNAQYQRNIDSSLSWLGMTEVALMSASEVMQRARELAVYGATGTHTAESRRAIADEVEQLIGNMVQISNTDIEGRYIFGGYKTSHIPFHEIASSQLDPTSGISSFKNIRLPDDTFAGALPSSLPQGVYTVDTVRNSTGSSFAALETGDPENHNGLLWEAAQVGEVGNGLKISIVEDLTLDKGRAEVTVVPPGEPGEGEETGPWEVRLRVNDASANSVVEAVKGHIGARELVQVSLKYPEKNNGTGLVAPVTGDPGDPGAAFSTLEGGRDAYLARAWVSQQFQQDQLNGQGLVKDLQINNNNDYNASILFEVAGIDRSNNRVILKVDSHLYDREGQYGSLKSQTVFLDAGTVNEALHIGGIQFDKMELGQLDDYTIGDRWVIEATPYQLGEDDKLVIRDEGTWEREIVLDNRAFNNREVAIRSFFVDSDTGEARDALMSIAINSLNERPSVINYRETGNGITGVQGDDLQPLTSYTINYQPEIEEAAEAENVVESIFSRLGIPDLVEAGEAVSGHNASLLFEVASVDRVNQELTLRVQGHQLSPGGEYKAIHRYLRVNLAEGGEVIFAGDDRVGDLESLTYNFAGIESFRVGDRFTTYVQAGGEGGGLEVTRQYRDARGVLLEGTGRTRTVSLEEGVSRDLLFGAFELDGNTGQVNNTRLSISLGEGEGTAVFDTGEKHAVRYESAGLTTATLQTGDLLEDEEPLNNALLWKARESGYGGNGIKINIVEDEGLEEGTARVKVDELSREVTVSVNDATARTVMDAVNRDWQASKLVEVAIYRPQSNDGTGLVQPVTGDNLLSGGKDNLRDMDYQGDSGKMTWEFDRGVTMEVNINGKELFVDGEVFDALFNLRDVLTMEGNLPGVDWQQLMGNTLEQIDRAGTRVLEVSSIAGSRSNRMIMATDRNFEEKINLTSIKTRLYDIDMAELIMFYKIQETIYQASLATGASNLQNNLVNYLR